MALTENSVVTEITKLPIDGQIQIKWRNTIEKDGEVLSAKDHYKVYTVEQKDQLLSDCPEAASDVQAMGW